MSEKQVSSLTRFLPGGDQIYETAEPFYKEAAEQLLPDHGQEHIDSLLAYLRNAVVQSSQSDQINPSHGERSIYWLGSCINERLSTFLTLTPVP